MLQLEQAQERVLAAVRPIGRESISIGSAAGRILAEDLTAAHDLPPFDNSAMDGYAVRADDLSQASAESPITLQLAGQVTAGHVFEGELATSQCVRLFTGSPIPAGADAVIAQEDTQVDSLDPNRPAMLAAVKPWENVRFKGEDVKRGGVLARKGQRLSAKQVGLLAAAGVADLEVSRKPTVGLLATGSELREPAEALGPGQIHESNRFTLAALVASAGAQPRIYPLVRDTLIDTKRALANALAECDFVVTTGGVSVGEMDFVKAAWQELGGELAFWRVAVKPGKPFVCGTWQGKLLFGLPGNPVSAFVTFILLARPALLRAQGASELWLPLRPGVLGERLINLGDRRHFIRVTLDEMGQVRVAGPQASHLLESLARANGLLDAMPKTILESGTAVSVMDLTCVG